MRAVTRTLLALAVAGRISAPATVAAQPSDERHQSKVGSPAPEIFTARAVLAGAQAPPGKDSVANGIVIGAAIGAGTGFALMGWAYAQCEGSCDAPEPLPMYLAAGGFGAAVGGVVGWLVDASRKNTNRRVAVNAFALPKRAAIRVQMRW